MKLGEIDLNLKPLKPSLFLCKPDKKTIAKINEAYDINYSTKLGSLNELSFKIPTVIEKDKVPITNENITRIKHRYLFKIIYGSTTEYFLFNERNKSYSSEEYVEYKALSLGVQLADKNVRQWSVESKTLSQMLNELLVLTKWKLGYVDSEFDLKYRSHDIASQNLLQSVYEIATKFNAVIKWDTVNLEINFFKPENVGLNKGLRFKEGKYLDSMSVNTNSEETITRLKVFGKDGLEFRRLSPTGSNYIEDFSYYIFPFKRDIIGNIISESYHMSNSLCIALEDYKVLLESKQTEFENLTNSLTTKQDEIQQNEQILNDLETELTLILNEIDVLNATFQDAFNPQPIENTPEHINAVARKNTKKLEIENQNTLLNGLYQEEQNIRNQILVLQLLVKLENNLTQEQILELDNFIIEKEYTNDLIVDEKDLLNEGYEVFKEYREPKVQVNLDIINFLSIVEAQNDWHKLVLGDIVRGKLERLDVDIESKIIEINYNFESDGISLVIANEKEIKDNQQKLMEMLYKASNTSTVVDMEKFKWNLSEENNGKINEIINNKWDAIKQAVVGGYDQKVEISERGIIVRSLDDPNTWLVIQNGHLAITSDNGNTWKHAITSTGIVGERVYGKLISGVNLAIEDESGIWITQGSRTTIYDRNGTPQMKLGLVTDAPNPECFGMLLDNNRHRVHVTSCEGFMIEKKENGNWVKKMYADLEGNFWVKDFTAQNLTAIDNDGYFKFEGNKGSVSDGTNKVMWFGYIPYGSVPYCSPSEDFGTILKGINNSLIYMTKTRGFAIDVDCVNKFKVDTDGRLYAQDITAHGLKIVNGELGEKIILDENNGITINGNNHEQIRLNANEGIAIDVNGDNRFWIGTDGYLYAKKINIYNDLTPTEEATLKAIQDDDGSYISNLTVTKLRTLDFNDPYNYVYIKNNYVNFMTRFAEGDDRAKLKMYFEGTGTTAFPKMQWGVGGTASNANVGYTYKTAEGFFNEYISEAGNTRTIAMKNVNNESILLDTDHDIVLQGDRKITLRVDADNFIEISTAGVRINGTRIDLN